MIDQHQRNVNTAEAILAALHICEDPRFDEWAWGWLLGVDRSVESAYRARRFLDGRLGRMKPAVRALEAAIVGAQQRENYLLYRGAIGATAFAAYNLDIVGIDFPKIRDASKNI